MTADVLVQEHRTTQHTNHGPTTARPPAGRYDCGCGRAGCHDEFDALAATTDPAARARIRDRLIESHLTLAYRVAGHYRHLGPGFEDVRQVAALALVEAAHRFDPSLGTAFSAFAVPTILGAVKRYFRDQRWTMHPPRRIKELRLRIRRASDLLTQQLCRPPGVAELATHLDCGQEEVREALRTDDAFRPLSIDAPLTATGGTATGGQANLAATLGSIDAGYAHVEDVEALRPLLAELPERERHIVTLRFAGNLTQSQIAERVGCSQMHVSRILRTALDRLRRGLLDGPARPRAGDSDRTAANHTAAHRPHADGPVGCRQARPTGPARQATARPPAAANHPAARSGPSCPLAHRRPESTTGPATPPPATPRTRAARSATHQAGPVSSVAQRHRQAPAACTRAVRGVSGACPCGPNTAGTRFTERGALPVIRPPPGARAHRRRPGGPCSWPAVSGGLVVVVRWWGCSARGGWCAAGRRP